jgi:hypothetical protein
MYNIFLNYCLHQIHQIEIMNKRKLKTVVCVWYTKIFVVQNININNIVQKYKTLIPQVPSGDYFFFLRLMIGPLHI